ncbi:hypothetical protein UM91_22830 [Pseudomonas oryzihabitans]|nr:hypothetical protein UM91_22830 [Pseudomonas oryzihabitans]
MVQIELNACTASPLSLRERVGVRAPLRNDLTPGKGCAVFQAMVQIELNACTASPLSLRERVGVRAPLRNDLTPLKRLRRFPGYVSDGAARLLE